ncbi:MAG TPA: hypothetical protein VG433_08745, partial [Pirellulales bacterium]|nr:hypothetical protein [Pirellulales bacterium]
MAAPFEHDVQFQRLRAGQSEIDLVDLLLEFAGDAYPGLDPTASRQELERLQDCARSVLDRLGPSATLSERLAAIGRLL